MATQIQVRRDTSTNWNLHDTVLAQGEMGYDSDTGQVKVGDGSTTWSGTGFLAGENNIGQNIGGGDYGIYTQKTGVTLQFRSLYASGAVTLISGANSITISGAGVSELSHSTLLNLGADDHSQYHNDTRGDARYYTQTQLNNGQLDNRYYTESEITTISGDIVTQIPTDYISDSEMTTISGDIVAQIPTDFYTTGEVDTISGALDDKIITDHGNLTGLLDDDHAQYVPVNASRGFTSTVSGVDPTQDYHLVTKEYADTLSGVGQNNTASNLGSGEGVYAQKVSSDLQFKSLVAGDNITLTSDSNTVTVSGSGGNRFVDGTYSGDSTTGRQITFTGGGTPIFVYIVTGGWRTWTGLIPNATNDADPQANRITAFGNGYFTVSDNNSNQDPNNIAAEYYWYAWVTT